MSSFQAVKQKVNANRNLCEDFVKFQGIKIEEISLCGDIELAADANVEAVQAAIYDEISKFLNPSVQFRTIDELTEKGRSVEEIFDGPQLIHGFLDNEELDAAERRQFIHVSDLIRIIHSIEGVIAVKDLQIANLPQDNDANIASRAVRWCMQLAFDNDYVPRLSVNRSKLTFFKGLLPFSGDPFEVEQLMLELRSDDRPQKLRGIPLDLPIPRGQYRDLEDYTSIQEDLPFTYGVSAAGLPPSASVARQGQTKQLKGYLMFFEQLLADYIAQLAHIKDLFSMDAEKDANGNFIINRSYYTLSAF